jgi:2-succinyl-5-enolpyruvyl-6-hydroxy-3-cyclohexene-1-carboxylate synthase
MINEAINLALEEPKGPVHINAPFREPFYPAPDEKINFSVDVRAIEEVREYSISGEVKNSLIRELSRFEKVLIVAGQLDYNTDLLASLEDINQSYGIPVAGDIISNVHPLTRAVRHTDVFLGHAPEHVKQKLQPDLLITFGKSIVSKHLKLFLRKYNPRNHWHIQPGGTVADPFQHVSKVVRTTPEYFFDFLKSHKSSGPQAAQQAYSRHWEKEEHQAVRNLEEFFPQAENNELDLVREVLSGLPGTCNLHLANSMSVRYANFIGLTARQKGVRVYGNRGTSGIDGCTSTVVGHCLESAPLNVLITGDLAFFYDRNAFWHNYPLPNLRVILLNNHGGIIFKLIDGPSALPESDEFFVTHQKLNGKSLCEEFGFAYRKVDGNKRPKDTLSGFFEPGGQTAILELESSIELNKTIFENLKKKIKHSYET